MEDDEWDDEWGEAGQCLVCGDRAHARLSLELRGDTSPETEPQGYCFTHMLGITTFIKGMQTNGPLQDWALRNAMAELDRKGIAYEVTGGE